MRRLSLMLMVALLAIALGLGTVACGSGGTVSGQTPEEAVTAAFEGLQTANSLSGTYEVTLTVDTDSAEADEMTQALLGQPIQVTGNFASQQDPVLADVSVGLDFMGISFAAGVRAVGEEVWLNVLDQWYAVPAEDLQTDSQSFDAELIADLQQAMDEEGIDPNTWYTDLTVVGDETLGDVEVSHLSATMDVQKMFTDMFALIQNPAFSEIMGDAAGAASDSGLSMPDATETEEIQATLEEMVESATVDMWIAEDGSLRKMVIATGLNIPEDAGMSGVSNVGVSVAVMLDAPDATIEVTAPASAKSIDELMTDLESDPMLSGLLGGLLGSGSDLDDLF